MPKKRQWTRQPSAPAVSQTGLGLGLGFLWTGNSSLIDLVRGAPNSARSADTVLESTSYGMGVRETAQTSNALEFVNTRLGTSDGVGTGNFTLFGLVRVTDVTTGVRYALVSMGDSVGYQAYILVNANTGYGSSEGYIAFGTGGGGAFNDIYDTGGAVLTVGWHFIVGRRFGTDYGIWLDGVRVKTATGTGARATDATNKATIGGINGYANYGLFGSDQVVLAGGYNRGLSEGEIAALTKNPWQVFRPINRPVRVKAPAGGGTNVSATTGVETWNGRTATLGLATNVAGTTGVETWNGKTATITTGNGVAATTGVETWNGLQATINALVNVTTTTGVETWNGRTGTIGASINLLTTPGTETWNGRTATVNVSGPATITATLSTEFWNGYAATVTPGGGAGVRRNRVFGSKKHVTYKPN